MKRPNIMIFVSHDTGRFLGCYGKETLTTPNLDTFAGDAVRFTKAFSTAPLCSPSRASLFTGLFPHQCGVNGLVDSRFKWDLKNKDEHLASLLKEAGYHTCLAGFLHETLECRSLPFDDIIGGRGTQHNAGRALAETANEVEGWLTRRDPSTPFYLQIGSHETHRGFERFGATPFSGNGILEMPHLIDDETIREDIALFQGSVQLLDASIGRILDALKQLGLDENTIIILTTDHGIDYPMYKGTFHDRGLETFLLMRYPAGGWVPGRPRVQLVSNIDIVPTLLDCLGLESPRILPGRSLLPVLKDPDHEVTDRVVFAEKTFHDCYDPSRSVRTDRHKYILHFEKTILADLRLGTMERSHWLKNGIIRNADEELYDLGNDPDESRNLIHLREAASLRKEMRKHLLDHMLQSDDPLLKGPISSPRYHDAIQCLRMTTPAE